VNVILGLGFALSVSLLGCATPGASSTELESVKVVDHVDTYSCKFLSLVSGSFSAPWDSAENMVDGALKDARVQAGTQGADTVVVQGSPQILFNSESKQRESVVTVNAYRCKKQSQ